MDKMCNEDILDTKKSITLAKYIFKAFELIEKKDESKDDLKLLV